MEKIYSDQGNLLINADFEHKRSDDSPDHWIKRVVGEQVDISLVQNPISSGKHSLKISASGVPAGDYTGIKQEFPAIAGRQFTVNGRFNVQSLNHAKAQLYVDFLSGPEQYVGAWISDVQEITNGAYMTVSNSGTVPANAVMAHVYVILRATDGNGSGIFYADSLNMFYGPSNMLSNGDFEQYETEDIVGASWEKATFSGVTENMQVVQGHASSGRKSQHITASNIPPGYYAGVMQQIQVSPGRSFTVTGRFHVERLYHAKVQLHVDFLSAPGHYLGSKVSEILETTNNEYITVSNSGAVPAGAKYALVYLLVRSLDSMGEGSFYADSLVMNEEAPNLLSDGGFEYGFKETRNAEGSWKSRAANGAHASFSVVQSPVFSGGKAYRVSGSNIASHDYIGLKQRVQVMAGKSLKISGQFNVSSLNDSKVQLYIDFMGGPEQYLGAAISEIEAPTNGNFIKLTNEATIPAGTKFIQVYVLLRSKDGVGSGMFYVDSLDVHYTD